MAKGDLSNNKFGTLVKNFREQRGWTQEELADKWGYTREYVSLVERGKRRLDRLEQVNRLADILEIPQDRLDAIGREIPQRKEKADKPSEADDVLLQTLLEPSLATIKLSWLLWLADGVKAQAHSYGGDIEGGINLALRGVELARGYGSKRHVSRVQGMYDRLSVTSIGNHPRMRDLKEVLLTLPGINARGFFLHPGGLPLAISVEQ